LNRAVSPLTNRPGVLSAIPGLHIISNFSVDNTFLINRFESFRGFIDTQIAELSLKKVGEVYHDFPDHGFTGVVCLTESHLSIHTWPEHQYVTFDLFLSNYLKDNRQITQELYSRVIKYFSGNVLFEQMIER